MERDCYAQEMISSRVIGVGGPSLDDNVVGIETDQWGNSIGALMFARQLWIKQRRQR